MSNLVSKKVDTILSDKAKDPFLLPIEYEDSDNVVSLGSVLLSFVSLPLRNDYSEVQLISYPFNSRAGRMHNRSIVSFPIPKDEFQREFRWMFKLNSAPRVSDFVNFISENFINNIAHRAWGFNDLYELDKAGKEVSFAC